MGQTIIEKIFASHAGKATVTPGEVVMAKVDLGMLTEGTVPGVKQGIEKAGGKIAATVKLAVMPDHFIPASTLPQAENHKFVRTWAKAQKNVIWREIGRSGVAHNVLLEEGLIGPGDLVIATDAHATTYGAIGCAGMGVGITDMAVALVTGRIWLLVPPTHKKILKGKFRPGVEAKDLALTLLGRYKEDGLNYEVIEFDDSQAPGITQSDRQCLCNQLAEAGSKACLFPGETPGSQPDKDAAYATVEEIRLEDIVPMVAAPSSPGNAEKVADVHGVRPDQVFIGSCTNGRIEDLRVAAKILDGKKVHERIRLIITPASQRIYRQAAVEGLLPVFIDAGAVITNPTCGACIGGHLGLLASGEVCVSTSNRNFIGRMGSREAKIYLVSPSTAAATAIKGELVDPREVTGR